MDLRAWLICPMIIHGNLIKAEMNSTKIFDVSCQQCRLNELCILNPLTTGEMDEVNSVAKRGEPDNYPTSTLDVLKVKDKDIEIISGKSLCDISRPPEPGLRKKFSPVSASRIGIGNTPITMAVHAPENWSIACPT